MSITYDKIQVKARAEEYCARNNTKITREIGFGTQGVVYKTVHNTALKVHSLQDGFNRERDIYIRLREREI